MSTSDNERRSGRRRPITLQVEYPNRQGYKIDYTESVSPAGIFIRTDQRHRIGDRIHLAISLPGFPDSIAVTGTVSRIRDATQSEARGVGVSIEEQEYFRRISHLLPAAKNREFNLATGPYSQLSSLPRLRLATAPTPLQPAAHLSKRLGGPDIWFKRDDLTGFALGGSEVRKLEFLAADALDRACDTLVCRGETLHSNHVRVTAACAAKLGLKCVACFPLSIAKPGYRHPLEELMGAEVRFAQSTTAVAEELQAAGRRPYVVDAGSWLGACAYVLATIEMAAQFRKVDLSPDLIICPVGSAGTHAGLLVGQRWLDGHHDIEGFSVYHDARTCSERVATIAAEVCAHLKIADTIPVDDIWVHSEFAGATPGVATPETMAAVQLVARQEGLVLDPFHNGPAMAGLIDQIERGDLRRGQSVVFLHTGAPANLL
jgi:1-aminocyclopropane-1-carboxylate deaminase/D-cysteine desulfhydrase-like pyridoxal-dependent ACC family enzyme/Tfp pilus assembly protein PilZ